MFSISSISAYDADVADDSIYEIDSQGDLNIPSSDVSVSDSFLTSSEPSDVELGDSEIDDGKFSTLQDKIDGLGDGETLHLSNDYSNDGLTEGIIISKNIRIEGNGYKLDALNKSRIFTITDSKTVALNNIVFMNGFSGDNGGAIYFDSLSNSNFTNLTFINNHAENHGGAIYIEGDCSFNNFTNVNLKNNTALRGGGIYFAASVMNNTLDFVASQNHVENFSGAVFFVDGNALYNIIKGEYKDNHADHCAGVLYIHGDAIGNLLEGDFENNTGLSETGGVLTLMGTASNNTFIGSFYNNSARIGGVLYFYLPSFNNTIIGDFINNSATKSGSAIYFRGSPSNFIINSSFIDNKAPAYCLNVTSNSRTIKALLIGNNSVANAFNSPDIDNLVFDNVTYWGENGLVNTDDILPIIGVGSGQKIILEIYKDNKLAYKISNITDKNGIALLNYPQLDPGNYTYLVYHEDNSYYGYIEQSGNISIPKFASKIIAKNKSFNLLSSTKIYSIVLKDNNNKVLKNKKVILKLNGKTYVSKTNSKGKATFKLDGFKKMGTFTAVISYAGDDHYIKASKKIKLKFTFKTIKKGSKDKLTVKKIQRALKRNGFYLTFKKHYLKVDGIYGVCTVRSVKEFQRAKGLKVTGKVNYSTAKKLGIL